ncbi:MaoC/PaaZ C-terminal domain-containing protein [Yinghuangia seranimata]|uniref:MaoC/PaaZ C-terminal domain-containing protein n=1 Tax=Yinghuangia seranimata TaxID=408067 RepID=UPI00248AC0F8|nr:MaoC/PaaZ C-terminal domain-containing protein [Yinghuangia seranimata]MDI2131872.1 MaoC/PaaZ C-terminal domain-containing protein [Yinghuangia seranimata]
MTAVRGGLPAAGTDVPPLERTMDRVSMVAYAGATWDWHRMHHDDTWAAERGLPAPVVDGQVFGALLAEQLLDWLGPNARLTALRFRFRGLVFAGERVRCTGRVTAVQGDTVTVEQEVVVLGADGAPERVAVGPAGATVVVGRPV